jgi:SNF2-related domain
MALLAYLMEFKGDYGPHLIIVPNAVIVNWKSELTQWLPSVRCVYYVGHKEERARKYAAEVQSLQFNVLVTTYEYIMRDRTRLSKVRGSTGCRPNRAQMVEFCLSNGTNRVRLISGTFDGCGARVQGRRPVPPRVLRVWRARRAVCESASRRDPGRRVPRLHEAVPARCCVCRGQTVGPRHRRPCIIRDLLPDDCCRSLLEQGCCVSWPTRGPLHHILPAK